MFHIYEGEGGAFETDHLNALALVVSILPKGHHLLLM